MAIKLELHKMSLMPKGFKCASTNCGLKEKENDLSLIFSKTVANAAGVFTKNQFPGAPIILGREIIKKKKLQAVVVNSKISNVGTGQQGIDNAKKTATYASNELNIDKDLVMISSTGVIGKQLPIELLEQGIKGISSNWSTDPIVAAKGIMTTDTYPKAISFPVGNATVTIIAKGSGMVEPNMATMLVYILTDAAIDADLLDEMLRNSVNLSFNMLSIDTDTSTSDTCLILANGISGDVDTAQFAELLTAGCIKMTKMLAMDGEGATKLLLAEIENAHSAQDAKYIAKSIINSPLIKTMAYGADPNIGRILMALGKCFDCSIIPEKLVIFINDKLVYKDLNISPDFDENEVRKLLGSKEVKIKVNLNIKSSNAIAYGCDLTEGYIKENAAYYSS